MAIDEFQFHTKEAKDGVLFIRSLSDADVRAAMNQGGTAFQAILSYMGPNTNYSWITGQAAEEAYRRNLIDETELDRWMD